MSCLQCGDGALTRMVAWRGEQERREWSATLDVAGLRARGQRPVPFREFVLKVHSRCDLACDYCYMYEKADQGWRSQPRLMSAGVVEATVARIAGHAEAHGLESVRGVLHGGEPLLAGAAFVENLARRVRTAMPAGTRADLVIQTNGTRLDGPMFDGLRRAGVL